MLDWGPTTGSPSQHWYAIVLQVWKVITKLMICGSLDSIDWNVRLGTSRYIQQMLKSAFLRAH